MSLVRTAALRLLQPAAWRQLWVAIFEVVMGPPARPMRRKGSRSKRPKNRRLLIVLSVVAVLALVLVGVGLARLVTGVPDTQGLFASSQSRWVQVQPPEAERELLAQGVIDGQVRVDVVAPFEGIVQSVEVELGDEVKKGAVLLTLSTSTLESQILEAKSAALKSAQAASEARNWKTGSAYRAALRQVTIDKLGVADAIRKNADTQRLFNHGIVARDELQQSAQAVHSAKSQLANSQESVAQIEDKFSSGAVALAALEDAAQQAKLAKLEGHLQASMVRSPIAGVVTMVGPRDPEGTGNAVRAVGGKATEGALIARVVDTTKIRVLGSIAEVSVGLVKAGQRATISPVSQPGMVLQGRVSRVSALPIDAGFASAFEERRTAKFQVVVEADVSPNLATALPKLGTNADIAIVLQENPAGGLLVPLDAVRQSSPSQTHVLARRPGQAARLVEVRTGATTAQGVHVYGLTLMDEVSVSTTQAHSALSAEMPPDSATDSDSDSAPDSDLDSETGEPPQEGLRGSVRKLLSPDSSSDRP